MQKERMLTVKVPIRGDESFITTVVSEPTVANMVENVIYAYNNTYYRRVGNTRIDDVTSVEFPEIGKPLELFDFTYDAVRMGTAPTISATAMWERCLDEDWTQECFVEFFGEKFYLKQIPTSSKNNEDARYKHEILLISERVILETTYFFDIVNPYFTDKPISESSTFRFFGNIEELRHRLNASLVRSGLSSFVRKTDENGNLIEENPLTYDQWQQIAGGSLHVADPYNRMTPEGDYYHYHNNIVDHYDGSYEAYLRDRVYETETDPTSPDYGDYKMVGYKVILGTDADGNVVSSEEKFLEFQDNYIHEALQKVKDDFELQYYIKKDAAGNTLIIIGDCEHNFGENDSFSYGVDNELLSIEKANTTDKIVTRITGVGSEDNIPWYYPNPCADGWIMPFYKRGNNVMTNPSVAPTYTVEEGAEYEKFLKNRLGVQLRFGEVLEIVILGTDSTIQSGYDDTITIGGTTYSYVYNYWFEKKLNNAFHIHTDTIYPDYTDASVLQFKVEEGHYIDNREHLIPNAPDWVWTASHTYTYSTASALAAVEFAAGTYRIYVYFKYPLHILNDSFDYYLIPNPGYSKNKGSDKNPDWRYSCPLLIKSSVPVSYINTLNCFYTDMINGGCWGSTGQWHDRYTLYGRYVWTYKDENGTTRLIELDDPRFVHMYSGSYSYDNVKIVTDKTAADLGWDGHYYQVQIRDRAIISQTLSNFLSNETVNARYNRGKFRFTREEWVFDISNIKLNIADYGLAVTGTPQIGDIIAFKRVKYITPQQNLMPEIFFRSDGVRRFYEAKRYRYPSSAAEANADYTANPDTQAGETSRQWNPGTDPESASAVWNNGNHAHLYGKHNTLYQSDEQGYYIFENLFVRGIPKEHIENFEDIKPTIEGMKNNNLRIDVIEEFAYDTYDDNSVWEDRGESGEYKHPHFFAKIRPLGFNIFDHALQEDMVISMKDGDCGACNFKIKVSDKTKKNVVQVWPRTVYKKVGSSYAVVAYAGTPMRYGEYPNLYVLNNGTYQRFSLVSMGVISGNGSREDNTIGELEDEESAINIYNIGVLDAQSIENGELGTLNASGWRHLEGDIVVTGRAQTDTFTENGANVNQQDTTSSYCWVALEKDTDTYGTLMPSASAVYDMNTYNIRPKSIKDVHITSPASSTATDEGKADKFVFLNIRMPQAYIREAEHKLSRALVRYMFDNNSQKFNFSIKFSRIFLAQNTPIEELLNENSVLYVQYATGLRKYKQYVSHYTYIMKKDAVLPEINVEMNQELSVFRNKDEQARYQSQNEWWRRWRWREDVIDRVRMDVGRRFIAANRDVVLQGNIASRSTGQSMQGIRLSRNEIVERLDIQSNRTNQQQIDFAANVYRKSEFVFDDGEINIGENKFIAKIDSTNRKLKLGVFSDEEGFTPESMDIVSLEAEGKRIKVGNTEVAPAFISNNKIVDYKEASGSVVEDHSITPVKTSEFDVSAFNTWSSSMRNVVLQIKNTVAAHGNGLQCSTDEFGRSVSYWYDTLGMQIRTDGYCYDLTIPTYNAPSNN